jgi:hypothetical protein
VTIKNAIFWDMAYIGLVRADVAEESIASIFRAEKSATEEVLALHDTFL